MKLNESVLKNLLKVSQVLKFHNMAGGDSGTQIVKVETNSGTFVVKTDHRTDGEHRFQVEGEGLKLLGESGAIRVPKVYSINSDTNFPSLVMEYVDLKSINGNALAEFGKQLAQLHKVQGPQQFGWDYDNYLGQSPQLNTWKNSWFELYVLRLDWQVNELKKSGELTPSSKTYEQFQRVRQEIKKFYSDLYDETTDTYDIQPSPLHGDLWSGNFYMDNLGNPVIIDPAFYWGHSEADLSIMTMFGNPGPKFFNEYFKEIPKKPLFEIRHTLYQLYHYVNHWIMFGGGYQSSSQHCLDKLCKFLDKN